MNDIKNISKIEIFNLWQKFDIEWNLQSDVNILAGINGSGKTTVLELISETITKGSIPIYYWEFVKKIVVTFNNSARIILQTITEEAIKKNETKTKLFLKLDFENINLIDLRKLININVVSTFDNPLKTSEDVRKLSDDNVKTELDWEIYKLQKEYLDYQLNISKRKDLIIESENDYKEEIRKLKQPQTSFLKIIDNLFSDTKKRINKDKNEISFITDDGLEISPYKLSSGEKQILMILLTVLVQDNKPAILFMDEPEISLHIDWQKKLIKHIKELNPNIQLIIATHSPAIIMEGWLDKVFEVSDIIVKASSKNVSNEYSN